MKKEKKYEGFTIIEVVLVLAIAGLIFLMVFIAWPALQRSQRDTQRRNDYSMLSTAVSNFATNNGGKIDKIVTDDHKLDPKTFINEEGVDPNGFPYDLKVVECTANVGNVCTETATAPTASDKEASVVYVVVGADCEGTVNGNSVPAGNASSRAFAIYGGLEGSGTFCSASQ